MTRSAYHRCPSTSLPNFLGWRLTKGSKRMISEQVLAYRNFLGSASASLFHMDPHGVWMANNVVSELQPWGGTLIFINCCSALLRFYMGWFVKGGWAPSRNIFDPTSRCEFRLAFTSFFRWGKLTDVIYFIHLYNSILFNHSMKSGTPRKCSFGRLPRLLQVSANTW